MDVRLTEFEVSRDLDLLREWLGRSHVVPWWGDAREALAHAASQPSDGHRVITVDGTACGYVCWQSLSPADVETAGLGSLAADHVDVDILIGDTHLLGRGVGPRALLLVAELLASRGVSSVGLGTDLANTRACRAFEKAGFRPETEFDEAGRRCGYFMRETGAAGGWGGMNSAIGDRGRR